MDMRKLINEGYYDSKITINRPPIPHFPASEDRLPSFIIAVEKYMVEKKKFDEAIALHGEDQQILNHMFWYDIRAIYFSSLTDEQWEKMEKIIYDYSGSRNEIVSFCEKLLDVGIFSK